MQRPISRVKQQQIGISTTLSSPLDFLTRYIMTNVGSLKNHFFKHLRRLRRIKHSRTTPYHPQGNGQCERMNLTLLGMLRTLTQEQKSDCSRRHLKKMVHAYNCSRNDSTGYSQYFLVFGRNPRLPIDLIFDIKEDGSPTSRASYVEEWEARMKEAYKIAGGMARRAGEKARKYHDRQPTSAALIAGDRVLVRNLTERGGPGKLRSYWEEQIHMVVRRLKDSPVYEVRAEQGGRIRRLHRNLLLQCNEFHLTYPLEKKLVFKKKPKAGRRVTSVVTDSDSDSDYTIVQTQPASSGGDVHILSDLNPHAEEYVPGNRRLSIISISEETKVQAIGGRSPADGDDTTDGDAAGVEQSVFCADLSSEDVAGVQNSEEGESLSGEEGSGDEHITNSDGFLSAEESHSSNDEAPDSSEEELGTDAKNGKVHRPRREVRPPQRLTYDLIGKPSNRAWIPGVQVFQKCEPWRPWE